MRWRNFFADLESQLEFELVASSTADAAELTRGAWSEITLMDRLRALLGEEAKVLLSDGQVLEVNLQAVGPTWFGGVEKMGSLIVPRHAISGVDSALERAVQPQTKLHAGPTMAAIYRLIARRREAIQVFAVGGREIAEGTIDRVGKDYLSIAMHARDDFRRAGNVRGVRNIPFDAIQVVKASPMGFAGM